VRKLEVIIHFSVLTHHSIFNPSASAVDSISKELFKSFLYYECPSSCLDHCKSPQPLSSFHSSPGANLYLKQKWSVENLNQMIFLPVLKSSNDLLHTKSKIKMFCPDQWNLSYLFDLHFIAPFTIHSVPLILVNQKMPVSVPQDFYNICFLDFRGILEST